MRITRKGLLYLGAGGDLISRFDAQTGGSDGAVEVASLVGGRVTYSDLMWLARGRLPEGRILRFLCDCALINIEQIKPYTDKYVLMVAWLLNPTQDVASWAAWILNPTQDVASWVAQMMNPTQDVASWVADAAIAAADASVDEFEYKTEATFAADAISYVAAYISSGSVYGDFDTATVYAAYSADSGSTRIDELLVDLFS